jgi:hypothetical protein
MMQEQITHATFDAQTGAMTVETTWQDMPPEQVAGIVEAAIQRHVDATARARGYRSGDACATYATSTNAAWQAEALAFVAWRDAVWALAFATDPSGFETIEDVIAALPAMVWPGDTLPTDEAADG